jgi:RNA polymerase sigma-70 factor, ECF subfamily
VTPTRPRAHPAGSPVDRSIEPASEEDREGAGAPPRGPEAAPPEAPAARRAHLERVRAREPEALDAFFEFHFDRVFGLVYRLLGQRAMAEDVTQEVFLKAHRALDRLDVDRDPGPWLTAIAYNACRDVWRSGAHRMARRSASIEDDPGVGARLTAGTNDPERDLLRAESEQLVREAIEKLPEDLRAAVLLYDYQDWSHQEIADLLGIQHAAARKRYSRALGMLGKMLKEKWS